MWKATGMGFMIFSDSQPGTADLAQPTRHGRTGTAELARPNWGGGLPATAMLSLLRAIRRAPAPWRSSVGGPSLLSVTSSTAGAGSPPRVS